MSDIPGPQEPWKITVDRAACIGSGICAGTAPGHFQIDEARSRPVAELVNPDETVLDAAASCPAEAITVHDAAGRQL